MPTPNTIVSAGSSSGISDGYPTVLVSTATELANALTSLNGAGGIICIQANITITAALVVPAGVMILGKYGSQKLTIGVGGSLSLSAKAEIRDLTVVAGKTTGNLVLMPESRALVRGCFFQVTNTDAVTCVYVTGSYNRILQTTFTGVVGVGPAAGIDYAAGSDNLDQDSYFE